MIACCPNTIKEHFFLTVSVSVLMSPNVKPPIKIILSQLLAYLSLSTLIILKILAFNPKKKILYQHEQEIIMNG